MIKENPGNPYLKTSGFFTSWDLLYCTLFPSIILASNKNPTVSKLLQFNTHLNQNISQPVLIWLTAPWVRCETPQLPALCISSTTNTLCPCSGGGCVPYPQQEVKGSNCSLLARKPFLESAPSANTRTTGASEQVALLQVPSPRWSLLHKGGVIN